MNLLNTIRKPYFAYLLSSLILFSSCNNDNDIELSSENSKFDYSFYQTNKNNLINLNSIDFINNSNILSRTESFTTLEKNNLILNEINDELGTNLDFDDSFKEIDLDSNEEIYNYIYTNDLFTEQEMNILNDFEMNLTSLGLDDAITTLEQDVNNANLSLVKFEQFQHLANTVKLLENNEPGIITARLATSPCTDALLGLAFAGVALAGACSPPAVGASVGFFCYVAGANYIRASISVGKACKR